MLKLAAQLLLVLVNDHNILHRLKVWHSLKLNPPPITELHFDHLMMKCNTNVTTC